METSLAAPGLVILKLVNTLLGFFRIEARTVLRLVMRVPIWPPTQQNWPRRSARAAKREKTTIKPKVRKAAD